MLQAAPPAGACRLAVVIRDEYGLRPEVADGMEREMARLFLREGIALRFGPESSALAPSVELRLASGETPLRQGALGVALLKGPAGRYAELYPSLILMVARDAAWGEAELLARVGAHEIGHLLLNSAEHAEAGIMRANWDPHSLLKVPHPLIIFQSEEARTMRLRLSMETQKNAQGEI
jgi:hypothetical protein